MWIVATNHALNINSNEGVIALNQSAHQVTLMMMQALDSEECFGAEWVENYIDLNIEEKIAHSSEKIQKVFESFYAISNQHILLVSEPLKEAFLRLEKITGNTETSKLWLKTIVFNVLKENFKELKG